MLDIPEARCALKKRAAKQGGSQALEREGHGSSDTAAQTCHGMPPMLRPRPRLTSAVAGRARGGAQRVCLTSSLLLGAARSKLVGRCRKKGWVGGWVSCKQHAIPNRSPHKLQSTGRAHRNPGLLKSAQGKEGTAGGRHRRVSEGGGQRGCKGGLGRLRADAQHSTRFEGRHQQEPALTAGGAVAAHRGAGGVGDAHRGFPLAARFQVIRALGSAVPAHLVQGPASREAGHACVCAQCGCGRGLWVVGCGVWGVRVGVGVGEWMSNWTHESGCAERSCTGGNQE